MERRVERVCGSLSKDSDRALRRPETAHLLNLGTRRVVPLSKEGDQLEALLQLFHAFVALGYKETEFVAEFLLLQRANLLYLRFAYAQFVIRNL